MSEAHVVSCPRCKNVRDPALASGTARPPCPHCGESSLHIAVSITEAVRCAVDTVSIKLKPAVQVRDWRQRWTQVQAELERLQEPRSEQLSAISIQKARHELHSFFVQAYHLKDSLIQDSAAIGVSKSAIENEITQNKHLALLADLANLDKHGKLTQQPRSGIVPMIKEVSGVSGNGTEWQLSLEIQHKSKVLDGLAVAVAAVSAWESSLRSWGLI